MSFNTIYATPVRNRQNSSNEQDLDDYFDIAEFEKERASFKPPADLYDAITHRSYGLNPEMFPRREGMRGMDQLDPVFGKPLPRQISLTPANTEITMGPERDRKRLFSTRDDESDAVTIEPTKIFLAVPVSKKAEIGTRSEDAVTPVQMTIVPTQERSRTRRRFFTLESLMSDSVTGTDVDVGAMSMTPQARSPELKAAAHGHVREAAATTESVVIQNPDVVDTVVNHTNTTVQVGGRNSYVNASRKRYPCTFDDCPQVCNSAGNLQKHLQSRVHKPPSYACLACEHPPYTRMDALKRHHRNQPECKRKHITLLDSQASAQYHAIDFFICHCGYNTTNPSSFHTHLAEKPSSWNK